MFAQLEVEVQIRKGLSPEWVTKNFPVAFDDLPEETTDYEIRQMAKSQVEAELRRSEDFHWYKKNWIIIDYHFT